MSASYTYVKSNNSNNQVSTSNRNLSDPIGDGLNVSSTIHVNPLHAFNKILVNKAKLSEDIIKMESIQTSLPTTEKIYYNPKFLTTHVKTLANIYNKQFNEDRNSCTITSDVNIHVNKNYLVSLNNQQKYGGSDTKQNRAAIHINPNFIKQNNLLIKDDLVKATTAGQVSPVSDIQTKKTELENTIFNQPKTSSKLLGNQTKSKYKLIKNEFSPTKCSPKKLDNTSKMVFFKTKYSLKRCTIDKETRNKVSEKPSELLPKLGKPQFLNTKTKMIRRLPSSEFKKLGSRKLVRKSVLQSLILARRRSRNSLHKLYLNKKSPSKKRSNNLTFYPFKGNNNNNNNNSINKTTFEQQQLQNSSFKRFSKMKIVRKSLLKAQIEARNQVRKQRLLQRESRIIMSKSRIRSYLSKFKLRNVGKRKFIAKQRTLLKWIKKKHVPSDTSRIKLKKPTTRSTPNPKKLKKNNQPCPFYNRFGRCKGKDKGTCPKLHDAKYISICRKFLQGECNTKDCLLSHDIRPGKMPTCHHYLAGLCTRPNCPFLHIKVNPKAPICLAFLQGFCPDVYNCLKRHEFICPKFAEKGSCPRGKSCTYPHRSPVILSKLLKDDQKPLMMLKQKRRTKQKLLDNNCCNEEESSSITTNDDDEVSSNNDANNAVVSLEFGGGGGGSDIDAALGGGGCGDDITETAAPHQIMIPGDDDDDDDYDGAPAPSGGDSKNPKKFIKNKKDFLKEPFTRYFVIAETNNSSKLVDELQDNNNIQKKPELVKIASDELR